MPVLVELAVLFFEPIEVVAMVMKSSILSLRATRWSWSDKSLVVKEVVANGDNLGAVGEGIAAGPDPRPGGRPWTG